MTPWMDAIDKLISLGYWIILEGQKLRYAYQGKDNPPQAEITSLLEVLKAHKADILNDPYFLIEQTIQTINRQWKPGTIKRLTPEAWERVRRIEGEINRCAFAKDTEKLKKAVKEYEGIWVRLYGVSQVPRDGLAVGKRKEEVE